MGEALEQSPAAAKSSPPAEKAATEDFIEFDDFIKVQLRVGQILSAESVPKSEKLLKLSVDVGEEQGPRQILAGIAKHYASDELPGRKVAVVANLKPRKMMGMESQGMLLAGSDDSGNLGLVSVNPVLPPGSRIS